MNTLRHAALPVSALIRWVGDGKLVTVTVLKVRVERNRMVCKVLLEHGEIVYVNAARLELVSVARSGSSQEVTSIGLNRPRPRTTRGRPPIPTRTGGE